jgi:hypothetical protein
MNWGKEECCCGTTGAAGSAASRRQRVACFGRCGTAARNSGEFGSRLAIESDLRETHLHPGSLFLESKEDRGVSIGPTSCHGLAHLLLAERPHSEGDFGAVGRLEREAQVFSGELERETRLEVAAEIGRRVPCGSRLPADLWITPNCRGSPSASRATATLYPAMLMRCGVSPPFE